jgi:hypothetical protein
VRARVDRAVLRRVRPTHPSTLRPRGAGRRSTNQ